MKIIELQSLNLPEVQVYSSLTENQLKTSNHGSGIFIAESPKVIQVALEQGYEPMSLLCERKHIYGDAKEIIEKCPEMPVYTANREILAHLTGYKLTRGVLCAMKRPFPKDAAMICEGKSRVAVIEAVCDTTNIGSIFRSAAALGVEAVLLTPDSCDPFNRRSIRVSMGSVFKIDWAFSADPVGLLNELGFCTVALALHKDAIPIDSNIFKKESKLGLVVGTEGDGLTPEIISKCSYKAIIPMHHGVDSLNVGNAAAIAFWELLKHKTDISP